MANSSLLINGVGIDGNEWDDSELIKAYDRAVKGWRKSQKEEDKDVGAVGAAAQPLTPGPGPWTSVPNKETPLEEARRRQEEKKLAVGNWIIGSPCRAVYTQDGLEYEAKIVAVEGPKCNIRFVGYGNAEKKELADLKVTFGKRSRDRQRREAQLFNYSLNPDLELEEYYSSVSLTSSMYNNCPESVIRGDGEDDQQTTTTENSRSGQPHLSVLKNHKKTRNSKSPSKRKREVGDEDPNLVDIVDQEPTRLSIDEEAEEVLPSGAEATMGSSSSSDISVGEDGDDEATSGPGVMRAHAAAAGSSKGFTGTVPRFPIPPMPISLAGEDGKFDFGRGHLPSLLLSWYMSGYHAGYFDARQELAGGSKNSKEELKSRSKRM